MTYTLQCYVMMTGQPVGWQLLGEETFQTEREARKRGEDATRVFLGRRDGTLSFGYGTARLATVEAITFNAAPSDATKG